MMEILLQGLALGLAYVAPIGMQNIYVINTALGKSQMRAYQVALITIFFDITLALSCFLGIGALLSRYEIIKLAVLLLGGIAVIYIGIQLIRSTPNMKQNVDINKSLLQVAVTCFTVTWLNPQAIIDGSLLLGGMRASLAGVEANLFILGVCIASFTWFAGLTTIVSIFKNSFNEKIIRWINIICGAVILYYGFKLVYTFVMAIL
jgi:L-lysine exporter family protein LysE/ArgO